MTAFEGIMHRPNQGWTGEQEQVMKTFEAAVAAKQSLSMMDRGTLNGLQFSAGNPDAQRRVALLVSRATFQETTT